MKIKFRNLSNLLIIALCSVFIIVLLLIFSVKPNKLLSSVYDIDSIKNNIDKVKVGDSLNYEINGYSKWKIIYVDKKNNTVDVVSKDNLKDITMETPGDFQHALDVFQAEADNYVDGKYAIKARSVTRADLDNFAFNEEFWTADNYNGSIAYTGGKINFYDKDSFSEDYYYLPYIRLRVNSTNGYNVGDEYIQNINGIDKWFVISVYWDSLILIPQDPIKFNFSDYPNIIENNSDIFNNLFNEFRQSNSDVIEVNSVLQYYGTGIINSYDNILNHYINNHIYYKILLGWFNYNSGMDYHSIQFEYARFNTENNYMECCYNDYYKENIPVTKGFRPVVTIKFDDKAVDGKETNTDISIGDNIDYNTLDYQNWIVLSIDKENNTAELVSGGIVKNIFLQGKDDFEAYEDILQNEVDKYKSGDNVISARPLEYSDLANLNKIKDKVNAKYWINSKKQFNQKAVDETSSPYNGIAFYNVGIMYYNNDNLMIDKKWVSLYIAPGSNQNDGFVLSSYNGIGELSFTAGIRPVIKVKLDKIEKIDDEAKQTIINNTVENDKKLIKEQDNNNKNSNIINYINNGDNSKNNITDTIGNKSKINNFYSNFSEKEKEDKLVKYILIGLILINVFIIIQVVLSTIIIKKIKKK